ncbi:hypothetical protein, partial [Ruminococcus callidus]
PPPNGGPPPLSGEAIMKIDFREISCENLDKLHLLCYTRISLSIFANASINHIFFSEDEKLWREVHCPERN